MPEGTQGLRPGEYLPRLAIEIRMEGLDAEDLARADTCQKELDEVLRKYRCLLQPILTLSTGIILPRIEIVPILKEKLVQPAGFDPNQTNGGIPNHAS